jgi:hypothetical protein
MKHRTVFCAAALTWVVAPAVFAQDKPATGGNAPAPVAPPPSAPDTPPAAAVAPAATPAAAVAPPAAQPAASAGAAVAPAPVAATPAVTATPTPVVATTTKQPEAPAEEAPPLLGLAIGAPDTGAMPGRFRPAFGEKPRSPNDWRFDFHGFFNVPLRLGINSRAHASSTQHKSVFHGPPLVPDNYERFEHTGVIPLPYVQLGFSYGNSRVAANVTIAARNVSNGQGFFDPPSQLGINDAFLTFKPKVSGFNWEIDVGGFANRYGAMGEYDTGRYDTSTIARVGGVGETMRFRVPISNGLTFLAEHGLSGQWDRAPLGVEPAGWNGFTDPNVGTSFAHHAHLGLAAKHLGRAAVHYVNAWTADDRTAPSQADGRITVLGLDLDARFAPYGRWFLSGSWVDADQSRSVSPVLRVLNTAGGPGLMREYLGPNSHGTGKLTTLATQYDVSIGEILRGSQNYSGYAPDVFVSAFGMFTHVKSDDADYDDVDKLKYGAELGYSALSWLAFSGRYDRVLARMGDDTKTFAALSPRVILRTDYNSHDQVTIQYSHWLYGSNVVVRNSYAPCVPSLLGSSPSGGCGDPSIVPDADTLTVTASMWW